MNLFNFKRLTIGIIFLAQGCITPVNMSYDTAIPLKENELSLSGAISKSSENTRANNTKFVADNFMLRAGFGLDGETTLYASYYHKGGKSFEPTEIFGSGDEAFNVYDHFDIGLKFSSKKQKGVAYKVMGGLYSIENETVAFSLYNSMIATKEFNRHVELSVVAHNTTVFFAGVQFYPGLNINAGFSSNRKNWVIRPEIGITSNAVSAGVGLELILGNKNI